MHLWLQRQKCRYIKLRFYNELWPHNTNLIILGTLFGAITLLKYATKSSCTKVTSKTDELKSSFMIKLFEYICLWESWSGNGNDGKKLKIKTCYHVIIYFNSHYLKSLISFNSKSLSFKSWFKVIYRAEDSTFTMWST